MPPAIEADATATHAAERVAPGAPSRAAATGIAVAIVLVVAAADRLTGDGLSLMPFYLGAIALAAWFAGRPVGLLLAALAVLVSAWAGLARLALPAPVRLWNLAMDGAVYGTVALLAARLRREIGVEQELARTEPETGLATETVLREGLARELERLRRYGRRVTLACLDFDDLGRSGADRRERTDRVRAAVAGTLRRGVRALDTACRLSGDRFAVLLPEAGETEAHAILLKLRRALAGVTGIDGTPLAYRVGAVTFERAPAGVDEMLRRAVAVVEAVQRGEGSDHVRHDVV